MKSQISLIDEVNTLVVLFIPHYVPVMAKNKCKDQNSNYSISALDRNT